MRTIVRGKRILTPDGLRPASLWISGGKVEMIGPYEGGALEKGSVIEAGDSAVLPGLVDSHVHVNQPGRTQWEGFETATSAAAAGGVTTIVDMPLNSKPVTTTLEALRIKRGEAAGLCAVDCGFWGGVVPGNEAELEAMVEAGVCGFKCFLIDSGIDDFQHVGEAELRRAMPILARAGVPLLVHAELCRGHADPAEPGSAYARYLSSRPKRWENDAIALAARLCEETGCAVHIVHLSSAEALPLVAQAKAKGLPFTAETCPHYLSFAAEEIGDGRTEFKCAPPIREAANRESLWKALADGTLDMIVSDHSPCSPDLKKRETGDFSKAWGGISSVQFGLSAVWTQAARRGIPLETVCRWMAQAPARLAGLDGTKGALIPGADADFIFFDPNESWRVEENRIRHRHKLTPYLGAELRGRVQAAYLRGEKISEQPRGRLLARSMNELHRTH